MCPDRVIKNAYAGDTKTSTWRRLGDQGWSLHLEQPRNAVINDQMQIFKPVGQGAAGGRRLLPRSSERWSEKSWSYGRLSGKVKEGRKESR